MKARVFSLAILPVLLAGGCARPAGYAGVWTRLTPLDVERSVEPAPWGLRLNVVSDASGDNPVLVARVEEGRVVRGRALQETYGRRVYTPWRPYAPLVKIFVSATAVLPAYFAWHDPTPHGLKNWGATDFVRDFAAWYNWFSAIPNGRREIELSERLIRTRKIAGALSEEIVGVAGRPVELYLDEARIATETTDADGRVRFDLGALLTPEMTEKDRVIMLKSPRPRGGPAATSWTLSSFAMRQLIRQRETKGEEPE